MIVASHERYFESEPMLQYPNNQMRLGLHCVRHREYTDWLQNETRGTLY